MEISVFDWLRWVDVPICLTMGGWLVNHARHDHKVELQVAEALGVIKTLESTVTTLLQALLERKP